MADETITLTLSRTDAEILLGLLAVERHNETVDEVCMRLREQIDQKLDY